MCGHAGIIIVNPADFVSSSKYRIHGSAKENAAADIVSTLLLEAQSFRGGDGFGLMALSSLSLSDPIVGKELSVSFVKKVDKFGGEWPSVIDTDKIFSTPGVICTHARKMTAGQKVFAATHPIHVDHITLMHNGSVPNWSSLFPKAASDTIGIAQMLAEKGIKEVAETIEGAKTLVWLDSTDNSLNFFKHKERPLYMCKTGSSFLYASEKWMVFKALDQRDLPETEWFDFKDQYHYKYYVETATWADPVVYEEPETKQSYYGGGVYGKKKESETAIPPSATPTAGTVVSVTKDSTTDDNKVVVLTKNSALAVRFNTIIADGATCLVAGRVIPAQHLSCPTVFAGKAVRIRVPIKHYAAFAGLVKTGIAVGCRLLATTNSYAQGLECAFPHTMVMEFDQTTTNEELDEFSDVAARLYESVKEGESPQGFLLSIRNYIEWNTFFKQSRTKPNGVLLNKHPARVNHSIPSIKINIPCL